MPHVLQNENFKKRTAGDSSGGAMVKNLPANAGDAGLDAQSGKSAREVSHDNSACTTMKETQCGATNSPCATQ